VKRVVALVALAAADLGLTLFGFGQGAEEANPIGAVMWDVFGPIGLVVLKVFSVSLVLVLISIVPRRRKTLAWMWALGLSAIPVGWNIALLLWVAQ
jgi:hypothetical protein